LVLSAAASDGAVLALSSDVSGARASEPFSTAGGGVFATDVFAAGVFGVGAASLSSEAGFNTGSVEAGSVETGSVEERACWLS
jgi:hypothetical protein